MAAVSSTRKPMFTSVILRTVMWSGRAPEAKSSTRASIAKAFYSLIIVTIRSRTSIRKCLGKFTRLKAQITTALLSMERLYIS